MALKDVHEKIDEIPEQYRELYTEKGGKYELTGIAGVKTSADVDRLRGSLEKERNDHKETKARLAVWGELNHDEIVAKLDKLPELEAAAKGKLDEEQIENLVSRRVDGTLKSRLAPIERENRKLKDTNDELMKKLGALEGERKQSKVHDAVRKALTAAKVVPEAQEDALLLADRLFDIDADGRVVTRDQVGVAPGLDPSGWLTEVREKKPHWWPASNGSGAPGSLPTGGGFGTNPWSAKDWNATQQGQYVKTHGMEKAERLAAAAGTKVGGLRPKPQKA